MDINLNKEFNTIISNIDIRNKPNLFLHVCCAPCSSAVLEKIIDYFNIYIIFYNSNIENSAEFNKRLKELYKLIDCLGFNIKIIYEQYFHNEFLDFIKGLESEKEGGKRCEKCYYLRLKNSMKVAADFIIANNLENETNYLATTLSISPYKDAKLLYEIGNNICDNSLIKYLPSDFKKEDGYLNSILLSKKYNIYRQNYCGCEFSKNE